jgi:hypothetical protein
MIVSIVLIVEFNTKFQKLLCFFGAKSDRVGSVSRKTALIYQGWQGCDHKKAPWSYF